MAAPRLYNRVRVATATTGTGTVTLGAAVAKYQTFAGASVPTGTLVYYVIEDGTAWEIGSGIYTSAGTTLSRTLISSSTGSLLSLSGNSQVFISGIAEAVPSVDGPFSFAGYQDGMINGTLVASVGSSILTVSVKTLAGNDPSAAEPVYILFRNSTAATGNYAVITLTAATSFAVSNGSTLGTSNSVPFRIWIVGFNDAGTFRIGVKNCSIATAIYPLEEGIPVSSTTEGAAGAADSAGVFYTGTGVTTKPFRILGYMEWDSGLATAGAWSAVPTTIQLFGPGVRKPGEVVQTAYAATTTGSGLIVAAAYTTALSISFTPTAKVNKVIARADGAVLLGVTLVTGLLTLFRDAVVLASTQLRNSNAATIVGGASLCALDAPGSVSALTYAVKVQGDGSHQASWGERTGDTAGYGTMMVQELMG